MPDDIVPAYPGSAASAWQILNLAHEFRGSCLHLMARSHGSEPHQLAPARVLAIHAIELYLNALMLDAGETPQAVRGLQHDLGRARSERESAVSSCASGRPIICTGLPAGGST